MRVDLLQTPFKYPCTEAKSQTIRRMQSSLETWDKQLEEIAVKKSHNGQLISTGVSTHNEMKTGSIGLLFYRFHHTLGNREEGQTVGGAH